MSNLTQEDTIAPDYGGYPNNTFWNTDLKKSQTTFFWIPFVCIDVLSCFIVSL